MLAATANATPQSAAVPAFFASLFFIQRFILYLFSDKLLHIVTLIRCL